MRVQSIRLLALLAFLLGLPLLAGPFDVAPDPLPRIQRIYVAADRLATELTRFPAETWKQLPRSEFEKQVQQAEQAAARAKSQARLVETHVRAVLRGEDLIGATTWKVLCPEGGPSSLPLQTPGGAFTRALRHPPREGDQDLLLVDVEGQGPTLFFDTPGTHRVDLAWSSRLERTAEGLAFDLRGLPCPTGVMEIFLPRGWGISSPSDLLVAGPAPLPVPEQRGDLEVPEDFVTWRIHGVGRGAFRLILNRVGKSSPPMVLVRRCLARHRLSPEVVESTFEVEAEPRPRGSEEIVFEWDPALRPVAVEVAPVAAGGVTPELAEWKLVGAGPQPGLLTLRFRGNVPEVMITIKALSPLSGKPMTAGAVEWTAPSLRAIRGVERAESIELLVHPDLRLDSWTAGDFRTASTDTVADAEKRIAYARWMLTGGGIRREEGTFPRRPGLVVHPSGVAFRARSVSWWKVDPLRTALRTNVTVEVQQGRLFGIPIQIPNGWEVEQVDVEPLLPAANWWLRREKNRSLVQVEFQSALTAASPLLPASGGRSRGQARVKLRLRPSQIGLPLGKALPFPELVIPGARFREGGLGIQVQEALLEGKIASPLIVSEPEEEGPWEREVPDFFLAYRQQALTGSLTLTARRPQLRGQVRSAVYLTPTRNTLETRVRLFCDAGAPAHVDLLLAGDNLPDWEWLVESGNVQVRKVEQLPNPDLGVFLAQIAQPSPLAALVPLLGPRHCCCRVTLSRPMRPEEQIDLLARSRLDAADLRWEVPLPTLLQGEHGEGTVELHLARIELSRLEQDGLREVTGTDRPRGRGAWRSFRYTGGPARLVLYGREATPERLAVAHGQLTAWPEGGLTRIHYRFYLADWNQPHLPVRLPAGAELLGACVDRRPLYLEPTGQATLSLPVPVREARKNQWLCYELLYQIPSDEGIFWQSLQAPAPQPAVEPITLQRTWRLPPGRLPAFPGQVVRHPSGSDGIDPPPRRIHPADLFKVIVWPRRWQEVFETPQERESPYPLLAALRAARPGQEMLLQEMLEILAGAALRRQQEIFVDTIGWRQARLQLSTRLRPIGPEQEAELPWESVGLSLISVPDGWLLTTRRQREFWGTGGLALPWTVGDALEEAFSQGYDRSGRFRSLTDWLPFALAEERHGEDFLGETLLPTDLELPGWSTWEMPGGVPNGHLLVIRRELVATGGLTVALLAGLVSLMLRGGSRWRRRLWFVVWLAVAGLALFWLPTSLQPLAWYPLVLGGILVLLAYLRRVRRVADAADPSTHSSSSPLLPAALIFLVVFLVREGGFALAEEQQTPSAAVNVLVVGALDAPLERQTVWAPTSLLERLAQATSPTGGRSREGTVLTGMQCSGKRVGNVLEFEAHLEVFSFSEKPALFQLPLEGGHLQLPLRLKGTPILPLAPTEPQRGYPIRLPGPGLHKLEVHFRVPIQSVATGEFSAQFTLPRAMLSRLNLTLPDEPSAVQIPGRLGALRTSRQDGALLVEADLGRMTGPVQIRWSNVAVPQRPGTIRYQEAYLWDLRPDAGTLTGVLQYSIQNGSVRELLVDVPDNLMVRGVTATRPEGGDLRLQGYQVQEVELPGGKRRQELALSFSGPLTGELFVELDLIPREPLPLNTELPLPSPRGEQTAGYLAYRAEGLDARPISLLRLTGIRPEGFAPFWPGVSRPEAGRLSFAATLTRPGGASPELRLQLSPRPTVLQIEQDISLRVGPRQVELLARFDVAGTAGPLTQVEWEIGGPPTTLASVRGPGVRRWSQQGNRLLVWFERVSGSKLEIHGWQSLVQEAQRSARLDLPQFRPVAAGNRITSTIRLLAPTGLTLRPQQLNGLTAKAEPNPSGPGPVYLANGNYSGSFQVEPTTATGTAKILTLLEVVERQLVFQTHITCRIPHGELRSLTVGVRGWEGTVVVEAERVAQRRERQLAGGSRTWTLDLQPGVLREYRLTLSGTCLLSELSGSPAMPEIILTGLPTPERWLVIAGPELQATGGVGVEPQETLPAEVPAGFRGAERLRRAGGTVWRVLTQPWQLPLSLAMSPREIDQTVTVLLQEQRLRPSGRGSWLHEATFWIRFEEQPETAILFPAPVRVTGLSLGDMELTPVQPVPERLWVPLPGQAGVLSLRVRWEYLTSGESPAAPLRGVPRLESGIATGPTLWTFSIPPGWSEGSRGELSQGPAARVRGHLAQAEAAVLAAAQLGELAREQGAPTGLELSTQQRFYRHLRRAEILMEIHPEVSSSSAPEGGSPAEWAARLQELNRDQARPQRWNYEAVRSEAERQSKSGVAPTASAGSAILRGLEDRLPTLDRGRRTSDAPLQAPKGLTLMGWTRTSDAPAFPELEPTWRVSVRHAMTSSLAWLGLVVLVGCLSQLDFLVNRLRPLIPEQLLLVGGLGYFVAGWTPLVLILLALGVLARVLLLVRRLRPRTRRRMATS